MHRGGAAIRALFCLLFVPPCREPFGCFEDPPVPLARRICCMNLQQYGFNPKLPWGLVRGAFGGSKNGEVISLGSELVGLAHSVSGFPSGYLRKHRPTG